MANYKRCLICERPFRTWTCREKIGAGKFCSYKCKAFSMRGQRPWNKGVRGLRPWMNLVGLSHKGEKLTDDHKRKIGKANSIALRGKKQSIETIQKRVTKLRGRKMSFVGRLKISKSKMGPQNNFWRGGVAQINDILRHSFEYKEWRKKVYERDNYMCVFCGVGKNLNADHIKPFSKFPDLRFNLDNGRTLCVDCHEKTTTFGRGALNYLD